ncbi:leucine-rich repeat domain-containing protein [Chengkuizengella sp. SCS-71B]|uniref:leucine-rich repeat domain-containing protein n=1 Tax=Chengkuizengella sp. SCS-71B TaxID=3115290 RepID=UPI0032C24230
MKQTFMKLTALIVAMILFIQPVFQQQMNVRAKQPIHQANDQTLLANEGGIINALSTEGTTTDGAPEEVINEYEDGTEPDSLEMQIDEPLEEAEALEAAVSSDLKIEENLSKAESADASSVAALSDLTLNGGNLEPDFDAGTTEYTVSVERVTEYIEVIPTADGSASVNITVNSKSVDDPSAIPLEVGENTIEVKVTAGGDEKTYTITVTRAIFEDENLEAAIKEELNVSEEITIDDLQGLEDLSAIYEDIDSIVGLEYAVNLTDLDLSENRITDISILSNLTKLTSLNLYDNEITDISILANLTKLTSLNLDDNEITDIFILENLTKLTSLNLDDNEITDISILAKLENLTSLDLDDNKITDISSLENLTKLTWLDLGNNNITDISSLENLENLTWLDLDDNKITDISSLENLTNLTYLDLHENEITDISSLENLTNLTRLDLYYNKITDISSLENLTKLTWLYLEENEITDISSLENLTNLTRLDLYYNKITDISSLENLTKLTWLYLGINNITDISSLENLTKLTWLDLYYNKITDISSLENLENLDFLNLYDNPLNPRAEGIIQDLEAKGTEVNYYDEFRNPLSNLSGIKLSEGTLSPHFDKYKLYGYKVDVEIESITVTPTAESAKKVTSLTVNGEEVTSGSESSPIPLVVGDNEIKVIVKAEDDGTIQTYKITVTRAATVPSPPTNVIATGGVNGKATVKFTPPMDDGGSEITGYEIAASPGNIKVIGTESPIKIRGLSNGTKYTFTVKAINDIGSSEASGKSNAVRPWSSYKGSNTIFVEKELTTEEKFEELKALGIFSGYADGLPHLEDHMSREQAAKVMALLFELDLESTETDKSFTDIPKSRWSYPYIKAASEVGIIHGIGNDQFDPTGNVTYEQFIKMLVEGYAAEIGDMEKIERVNTGYVSEWAEEYVFAAIQWELIKDRENYRLYATREFLVEAAYTIYQLLHTDN